jgi:hypothetical protein
MTDMEDVQAGREGESAEDWIGGGCWIAGGDAREEFDREFGEDRLGWSGLRCGGRAGGSGAGWSAGSTT